MRIMFMGTPEISATCLRRLVQDGHNVVAVVTGEDKPRGRKMILTPTETKMAAEELSIPVYTPKTLRDGSFDGTLREISPELIAVVAYGKILPKSVIDFPKYGCINLHVSLLPKYRGAAPMQRAIMEGESETGVTVMQMDEGLDTGDIIETVKFPIGPEDDFEASIQDQIADAIESAEIILVTVDSTKYFDDHDKNIAIFFITCNRFFLQYCMMFHQTYRWSFRQIRRPYHTDT